MEYIVTTVLLVIIASLTVLNVLTHKSKSGSFINKIPGPNFWPIIGNTLDLLGTPEETWNYMRKNANEYYSIWKLWLGFWPVVNLCHPDDAEVLLTSQKNISKSFLYDYLHPWLREGLLTSTGNKWRGRRKTLTPAFHFNVLQEFVGVFVENSERAVEVLKREGCDVVKDVVPFFAKFTLNAICESAMGTALQEKDSLADNYRSSVKNIGDIIFYRTVRPWLLNDWIFSLTRVGREQRQVLNILHSFTTKIIEARKKYHEESGGKYLTVFSSKNGSTDDAIRVPDSDTPLKKKRLAMLDLLIGSQKERNDIDNLGIREEVDTFIFEGHDTTVMGLSFALLLLAEHREIQERARAEIDSVLKESDGKLTINELQNLSYIDRCIKESLRMFPPVPFISREVTSEMHLKSCVIPRGATVNLHIFDVHRDANFWPKPHVYDPDRFLPDRIEGRHPFSYVPFSGGPRNCIGQKFAMLELKVFIGLILHNFYLEPLVHVGSVRFLPDLVLKSVKPLNIKFTPIR